MCRTRVSVAALTRMTRAQRARAVWSPYLRNIIRAQRTSGLIDRHARPCALAWTSPCINCTSPCIDCTCPAFSTVHHLASSLAPRTGTPSENWRPLPSAPCPLSRMSCDAYVRLGRQRREMHVFTRVHTDTNTPYIHNLHRCWQRLGVDS